MLLLLIKNLVCGITNPVYWFGIWVTYRNYQSVNPSQALKWTVKSVLAGLVSGNLGMLMVSGLGLSVQMGMYLALLFPAALILAKIRPRFCCFAYSGALLGILGVGDARGILAVVGLLHIMEGFLCMMGMAESRQLVWRRASLQNSTISKGCWPVPFALLVPGEASAGVITMPGWWPLLGEGTYFSLFPMTALILYQAEGGGRSGRLLGYGIMLLGMALILGEGWLLQRLALILMVFIHEWILLE